MRPASCPRNSAGVAGIVNHYNATGITSQAQRIVFTNDAGRTWHVQYTSRTAT